MKNGDDLRLPPNDAIAEQGLLACMLSDGLVIGDIVASGFSADWMYDIRHRELAQTIIAMWDKQQKVDIITLQSSLKSADKLEAVGGMAYIATVLDVTPGPSNWPYYAAAVKERYVARRLIQVGGDLITLGFDTQGMSCNEIIDLAEKSIADIGDKFINDSSVKPIKQIVADAIADFERAFNNKGQLSGLPTGFSDLDRMTGGFKPGEMIVIAARPSAGKTSLALNLVENIAVGQGVPVGVFSLEMQSKSLVQRMMCGRSRINMQSALEGDMGEADFPKMTMAAGDIVKSPIYIDDTPSLSILQVRARARRMVQKFGVKLLVVDYLGLILPVTGRRNDNRQVEIANISNGIKSIARELSIPVIIVCQLNRDYEKANATRTPRLSDLRESGQIEADADFVGLLYPVVDEDEDPMEMPILNVNLLVAKQRNGKTGYVKFVFFKEFTRFEPRASDNQITQSDVPNYDRD